MTSHDPIGEVAVRGRAAICGGILTNPGFCLPPDPLVAAEEPTVTRPENLVDQSEPRPDARLTVSRHPPFSKAEESDAQQG